MIEKCTFEPLTPVTPADYIGDYWLVKVDTVDDITEPDYDHAWITPDNQVYVLSHDGSGVVPINTGGVGEVTHISNTDNLLHITGSGTYSVTVNVNESELDEYIFNKVRELIPCPPSGCCDDFDALIEQNIVEARSETVTSIGDNAFYGIISLTIADFPNATSIGLGAFGDTQNLTTVDFSNVTSIANSAFNGASSLTNMDFPNLASIGNFAFQNATSLATVILRNANVVQGGVNMFTNTPITSGNGYIYVPDDLVEDYKTAQYWTTYASQIRPISELEG